MSTIADSPSPHKIVSHFTVNGREYDAVLEYCETEEHAIQRMRDWAGWHGSTHMLSRDGRFFEKVDQGGNVVTFRMEPVAADSAGQGDETAAAAEEVEIDGRAYRVTASETTESLRRWSPRAAESWQRRGIIAKVELRRGQRGRRPWVAYQRADGSFSRPWRGSLIAN